MSLIVYDALLLRFFFFFNDTATTEIYTLSLHDALPISNDAGRLGNGDGRTAFAGLSHRQTKPGAWFQSYNANINAVTEYDFGGTRQYLFAEVYGEVVLKNFWDLSSYVDFQPRAFDHSATRGGPEMPTPERWNWGVRLASKFGAKNSWVGRCYYGEAEPDRQTYRRGGEGRPRRA